ncbi:hypothetical protein BON22_2081 [Cyberlindnera fabianii]|uniref:Uncharacterized protein n=1 Tax=Cyberlindnera fabianii TaxID=36022 RepID=A0A1V2L958_CYBFA|nr:hypothetical protein BON22_2081 [Cyberlindnera fabianii]
MMRNFLLPSIRGLFGSSKHKTINTETEKDSQMPRTALPIPVPFCHLGHKKEELQTKHIKVITRQDIINGTYALDSPSSGSTSSTKTHTKQKRSHSHRRHSISHRSPPSSFRGTSPVTPAARHNSAPAITTTTNDSISRSKDSKLQKTAQIKTRHTFGGIDDALMLVPLPLGRMTTRDSDISEASGFH